MVSELSRCLHRLGNYRRGHILTKSLYAVSFERSSVESGDLTFLLLMAAAALRFVTSIIVLAGEACGYAAT